ncbi:MAG: fumarylacetoacetate hydrolase family protein [Bacteroidia bacterium]|nr:fumarylacetoacetate hydrolase family protein [Bacteroidia bacterium]
MKKILLLFLIVFSKTLIAQTLDPAAIKLFRFGEIQKEKPAVEYPDGTRLDVTAFGEDYNEKFFETDGVNRLQNWLIQNATKCPKVGTNERFASCVARPSKIVGIGLNYAAHAAEAKQPIPNEPVLFLKATTSLSGANDNIPIPKGSVKLDYEAEIAIIIGKKATYVSETEAMNYVAGFAVANDVSERNFQLERTGQWTKGKSHDGFCPLGPYLVTKESVGDPQNLKIWLTVNGQKRQDANTSDMIFNIKQLVSRVSQFMTLLPGDVIVTGTPSGVAIASGRYLQEGDIVELGIEKLGTQKQKVISFIQSQLTEAEYKEYQAWIALGVGGLPHTLEGFRSVQNMNKMLKDGTDWKRIEPYIGEKGDVSSLKNLPQRKGSKPNIAPFAVPHRQTDQHNTTDIRDVQSKIFDDQVANSKGQLIYKNSYLEIHNPGIFLKDSASGNPTIVPISHAEIGHIHKFDGSMHLILSPSDTKEVILKGWGELHGLAAAGTRAAKTYMMIYSPRDQKELKITTQILEAAVKYQTFVPKN